MPAPSLTEMGKLSSLGLIRHYQTRQHWYIQQGKVLVASARLGVRTITKTNSGGAHVFSQDEVAQLLRVWFIGDQQWQALLLSKPHLPVSQYDVLLTRWHGMSRMTLVFRLFLNHDFVWRSCTFLVA
jgi:hypothetical protein